MKLDDEIVELKECDAVRVPPGTWRVYEAGRRVSKSLSSARPISARRGAKTLTASATGGLRVTVPSAAAASPMSPEPEGTVRGDRGRDRSPKHHLTTSALYKQPRNAECPPVKRLTSWT
jgi:hypothetical protein